MTQKPIAWFHWLQLAANQWAKPCRSCQTSSIISPQHLQPGQITMTIPRFSTSSRIALTLCGLRDGDRSFESCLDFCFAPGLTHLRHWLGVCKLLDFLLEVEQFFWSCQESGPSLLFLSQSNGHHFRINAVLPGCSWYLQTLSRHIDHGRESVLR